MSGGARDFNNIKTRAVINFFFSVRQGQQGNSRHSDKTLGEHAPSYVTVKNRVAQFKRGDSSNCDAPRPGRPKTVTTPENIKILKDTFGSLRTHCAHNTQTGFQ